MEDKKTFEVPETSTTHNGFLRLVVAKAFHTHTSIRLNDGRRRRRRLSVRETSRLQNFPDWFEFSGTKENQFTQIGCAVPPMFPYKLAQSVVHYLKREGKYLGFSVFAKTVAEPAIKAASLAGLAKVIS